MWTSLNPGGSRGAGATKRGKTWKNGQILLGGLQPGTPAAGDRLRCGGGGTWIQQELFLGWAKLPMGGFALLGYETNRVFWRFKADGGMEQLWLAGAAPVCVSQTVFLGIPALLIWKEKRAGNVSLLRTNLGEAVRPAWPAQEGEARSITGEGVSDQHSLNFKNLCGWRLSSNKRRGKITLQTDIEKEGQGLTSPPIGSYSDARGRKVSKVLAGRSPLLRDRSYLFRDVQVYDDAGIRVSHKTDVNFWAVLRAETKLPALPFFVKLGMAGIGGCEALRTRGTGGVSQETGQEKRARNSNKKDTRQQNKGATVLVKISTVRRTIHCPGRRGIGGSQPGRGVECQRTKCQRMSVEQIVESWL